MLELRLMADKRCRDMDVPPSRPRDPKKGRHELVLWRPRLGGRADTPGRRFSTQAGRRCPATLFQQ